MAAIDQQQEIARFHHNVYEQANKLIKKFILGFFIAGILLNAIEPSWWISILLGGLLLGLYFTIKAIFSETILRYATSLIIFLYFLQYFFQTGGLFEIHFIYFIGLAILLFYEDWRVLLPPIALMVVGWTLLYVYQNELTELLPEMGEIKPLTYVLHLLLVLSFSGLCLFWAEMQRRQTKSSALASVNMGEQLKTMDANISFANQIAQGNLKADYPATEVDRLGTSLLEMRDSLVKAVEREEQERFYNSGLAQVGDILRQNSDDIKELCETVLQFLVKYVKANQGALFVVEESEGQDPVLNMKAIYAWERKKFLQKTIDFGQGLVGQVALEKRTVFMTKVPNDYIRITSGLGTANPNCLLVVPLKSENDLVGVMELASFQVFSKSEISFIEKVSESIATVLITARNAERTKNLLESTSQLTEQLKSQEEEIRQNMEEMQATQEEMARAQKELARKAQELEEKQNSLNALINNTDDSILAMDTNYKVIIMNNVLRNRYKGTQYESLDVGSDALVALGAVRDEWKGYYDQALNGEKIHFTIKSTVQGEDMYREYYINPMRDQAGKIVGLSVFSRDVTLSHRAQKEMLEKSSILDSIINHTTDTYFAIDNEYRILIVNEVLKNRFRASNIELKEGDSILALLPKEGLQLWKDRYDRALQGEKQRYEEERKVGDKTLFLEVYVDPIKNKQEEIIGCSVISRDFTEKYTMKKEVERLSSQLLKSKT